jgi:antitoxin (DNA-binding transcriptional repressor) of toxin-antitoxin stability system
MSSISVQEAQAQLSELIRKLGPGDEVILLENDRPVARLLPAGPADAHRKLGSLAGTVTFIAPDFDAPLEHTKVIRPACFH